VPETRSRRRGEQLEAAILQAAWDELTEVGYNALTIERVASRAGTSKPVIYRRWSSRAELVLAAWGSRKPARLAERIDTGSLRGDLIALFTRIARRTDAMLSETIAGVMSEVFRHPEVAEVLRARLACSPLAEALGTIVGHATERGELPPVELTPRAARVPLDLIRNEAMMCHAPVSEESITALVDEVYLPMLRGLGVAAVSEASGASAG
jgi:AcrR family transcriptional regulator